MTHKMRLSICVPSRNRQYYFQKTIESLTDTLRDDVEFVFVDNSDDPSVMNEYMRAYKDDPRVTYVPSADRTLSMKDNWERALEAATGDWVTFIGDDDYVEPEVMTVIKEIVKIHPEMDAVSWGVLGYNWPTKDTKPHSIMIPFNAFIVKLPRDLLVKKMFGWHEPGVVPTSGFSIYHSAISRTLLEKIKKIGGGKYFEHPVIDYDMGMKVIVYGRTFSFCQRPFSVTGSCPQSNSYSIGKLEDTKRKMDAFMEELGHNFEDDPLLRDFPFHSYLGVTATVATTQLWFKKKYKLRHDGWERNFAVACAKNVEKHIDREAFDAVRDAYAAAFRKWENGKFLGSFAPVFKADRFGTCVTGSSEAGTYIRSDIGGATTPRQMFDAVNAMTKPVDQIAVPPEGLRFPWEEECVGLDGKARIIRSRS
ncbi:MULTISPECIES: glycosyltransferase family 2 protein [Alphaproteobacteria]|uniref:Glycosyltransferase 2-like domain-containing protein n=2 Tax=Alphaproteobacteria TaxID=28211 RepID=A0A512HDH3_9HYPH|nr:MULTISPECIES: glycosyltransferase family 2 protein [Alphaproteobacteria]GEO83496.1 hypothetical protein RNA01_04280 [Ciceribacter naphthalenivorans]GLR24353.1 hypothetical protein GCM10007920_41470 [Ciceribacter naphthalenivorans]GLT07209.1 hypothetical protein GCM10007926_41470 [Sphingomonas psychrolutea]